jgi:hypothetical protein
VGRGGNDWARAQHSYWSRFNSPSVTPGFVQEYEAHPVRAKTISAHGTFLPSPSVAMSKV